MPGSPLALYSKHSAGCLGFSQQARQRTQCSKWLISISIFNMDQGKWSIITQQIQSQWNSQPSITEPHCLPVVFLHSSRASMSSQKASLVFTDFTQGRVWFLTQVNLCWRQSLELQHYQQQHCMPKHNTIAWEQLSHCCSGCCTYTQLMELLKPVIQPKTGTNEAAACPEGRHIPHLRGAHSTGDKPLA